jgi:hypothetical protein
MARLPAPVRGSLVRLVVDDCPVPTSMLLLIREALRQLAQPLGIWATHLTASQEGGK